VIRLTTYADARDAYRRKELRQALYDEGRSLMDGVIVNLHGADHLARRRLENRLFRRDTFAWYEAEVIPGIIREVISSALAAGRGDLLPLARRTMLTLSLGVAGVDRRTGTADELDDLYALMDRLARASTVAHATGDRSAIIADGDAALAEFERTYFRPSLERRRRLVGALERGELDESELPRDVLTTLLRNQDRLDLPPEVVLREIAYFPWVGSHSTSNQFVHAMHHVFTWLHEHPDARRRVTADPLERQRFVHESLRLHPASPVSLRHALADITLRSGTTIAEGSLVAIDLESANRDPSVFGDDADRFDPYRALPDDVAPWGLSFGHGVHACLGQELAGGLAFAEGDQLGTHLFGSISVMAGVVLEAGAAPDPNDPRAFDTSTTREVFARYPVVFDAP
jgi:cytochrome P450